jgi:hypothetical protein
MSKQDIIRMAQEAGFHRHHNPDLYDCMVGPDEAIKRFAALVAAVERERAALKVEELDMIGYGTLAIAAAIRQGDQE